MTELNKEYFDKKLGSLATKKDLKGIVGELRLYTDEQTGTLARIVNKSFQDQKDHFDRRFDKFEKRFDTLETGQEEIKLRLDNVAYRFELVELQKRVDTLEEKVGIKPQKK